jgi:hypothetical protein
MKFRSYLVVVAFGLFVLNAGCSLTSTPSGTVMNSLRYLEKGEIEEAAKLFSTGYINKHGGLLKVTSIEAASARAVKEKGGYKSLGIVQEAIFEDLADVTVKAIFLDNTEIGVKFKLIKENGEWKIDDHGLYNLQV